MARDFSESILWLAVGIFPLQNFTVPFTYWLEAHKLVTYIAAWGKFLNEMDCEAMQIQLRMKRVILLFSVAIMPFSLFTIHLEGIFLRVISLFFYFPYLFSISSRYIIEFFWFTAMSEIRTIGREMLNTLQKADVARAKSVRKRWLLLSRLSAGLGDALGGTFIELTVLFFTMFLLSSYGIVTWLLFFDFQARKLLGLILTFSFSLCQMFLFCDLTHRTTHLMSDRFTSSILELHMSTDSKAMGNELVLFLKTISTSNPTVFLLGSVKVSRTLFVLFTTNCVTYLVVLMQFKLASNALQSNIHSQNFDQRSRNF